LSAEKDTLPFFFLSFLSFALLRSGTRKRRRRRRRRRRCE
jgi:hypothetical protein